MKRRAFILSVATLLSLATHADGQDNVAKTMLNRQLKLLHATPVKEPAILRLDLEMLELLKNAQTMPESQRVQYVASGMSPQKALYATFGMPNLNEFSKFLLGKAKYPNVNLHRDAFAQRDLSQEIRTAYTKCCRAIGRSLEKAPVYKVAYGYQRTTNAQMQGMDQRLGRNIIVLNRSALAKDRHWDAAIIHETWHCFQQATDRRTLLDRAMHEGIVTHLTQVVDPTLADHTVMLWSKQEWNAAYKNRDAILQAFAKDYESTDPATQNQYMILGRKLASVPSAPSRCGYFAALLAVRAWQEQNPKAGPAKLLAASSEDIWQSLTSAKK